VSPFWTLRRASAALGLGALDDRPLVGVSTDTRSVQPGDLFVALRGERFDAHDFLAEAVARGAAALVVSDISRAPAIAGSDAARASPLGVPILEVDDTLRALGRLANYRRRAWARPVIAIGGSNGKTSTKELVRAALGSRFVVHATSGNLNNQIGVPLSLLALPDDADVAVIEMGTNVPGEITLLRAIAEPDVALVTTVQEEHLEGFGDLAGVLREEASLFDGSALAIAPADESALVAEALARARRTVTAGLGAGDLRASEHGLNADGSGWLVVEGERMTVPLRGAHNLRNAMLALAAARACGVSLADAARGIGAVDMAQFPAMRSSVSPLGEALLINDAYNANPGSARAAIALLTDVAGSRQRAIILGTMRELGDQAERAHREIAREALRSGAHIVAGIGDFARALAVEGMGDDRVVVADDVDDLWRQLEERLASTAAILLKASRGVRLERLVPLLTEWAVGPYRA
jgi:UDP-N-acetylmuramoyl-tripeptide--D-alanyl-D-alanine ligase